MKNKIWKHFKWRIPATTWVSGVLAPNQVANAIGERRLLPPNAGYINIMLQSMRVPYSRRGWNAYCGAVHCFSQLQYRNDAKAEFHALATPAKLKDLDPSHASRIEMGTSRLLGPIPYRGGDVTLEIGLFSAKTDLAVPYLALLGKVAAAAGLGTLGTAVKVLDAFREGIDGLHGHPEMELEIGSSNTFSDVYTGCYVLVAQPAHDLGFEKLSLDPANRLLYDTQPVTAPHVVFSVEASTRRDDFATLPDLSDSYQTINDFLAKGLITDATKAFDAFRLRALRCPDLLLDDARRIVNTVRTELMEIAKPMQTGSTHNRTLGPLRWGTSGTGPELAGDLVQDATWETPDQDGD